jgi:hypothetical protein
MHLKDTKINVHRMTWYTGTYSRTAIGLLLLHVDSIIKCFFYDESLGSNG